MFRTFHEIDASTEERHRRGAWPRCAARSGPGRRRRNGSARSSSTSTPRLVEIHSENKEQAAPTYKGGFGFHPMFCFADATGETLAGAAAAGQRRGQHRRRSHRRARRRHRPVAGDDRRGHHAVTIRPRATPGHRAGRLGGVHRGVPFGLPGPQRRLLRHRPGRMPRSQPPSSTPSGSRSVWLPALAQDGELREGAAVAELTSLIDGPQAPRRDPADHPAGTPPPRCPAQPVPLLDYRYWGFYTDQDGDPRTLDATMRAHAHVERHIQRLKDSGLCRFPFTSFEANATWMMAVSSPPTSCGGSSCSASTDPGGTPDPRRCAGGSSTRRDGSSTGHARRVVRIIDGWPTTEALLDAYRRIALIT